MVDVSSKDHRPHLKVEIMGTRFRGLLDSGASCTILGVEGLKMIESLKIQTYPVNLAIKTVDGTIHSALCGIDLPYTAMKQVRVVPTLIMPSLSRRLILGIDFWESFGIKHKLLKIINCDVVELSSKNSTAVSNVVSQNCSECMYGLTDEQVERLNIIKSRFKFSTDDEIGKTNVRSHVIDTGDAKAIVKRPYSLSPYMQKEVDIELDRMVRLGIIEKAESEWANPLVCVRKPTGKVRLCLDARGLNNVTIKDAYPLPVIGRILGQIRATNYLSSLDLSDAFWQVPLEEKSQKKTAFIVPGRGLFMFKRMPFGLCNSAQTMCKVLDECLGHDLEPEVFVYIDDIIVMADTFDRHLELLGIIAKRLNKANLSISSKKSKFCANELKYLGYVLNKNGVTPDPEKVSPILNIPSPKNVREVRRLIGMANWYRRFVKDFSTLVAPITNLLKNPKKKFVWTDEANLALINLKSALVSSPILITPDYSKMFTIQCDASEVGIGAVLTQGEGDDERVVAYYSEKLSQTEKNYSATERECLGVVRSVKKFRHYVEGVRFRVITDHASLLWLVNLKDPASKLARWALKLQEFDFEIVHRKGKLNVVADTLSRSVELYDIQFESNDENYTQLLNEIKDYPSRFSMFRVDDNKIYKHCIDRKNLSTNGEWKLYIPANMRSEILKKYHDDPLGGHLGAYKTLKKVQVKYYWPKMSVYIDNYVRRCEMCQVNKHPNKKNIAPMGCPKEPRKPWEMIAVDYMGPFVRSKSGSEYLLVIVDVFSKYCILKPMRRAESRSLVKFIEEDVFLVYGVPNVVITDNGPQFISSHFKELLKEYQVYHSLNAAYHPQVNPAERLNRSILSSVRSYIKNDHRDWDIEIPKIACAFRTATHASTKFTPYFINFGQEMQLSGERSLTDEQKYEGDSEKCERLQKIRENVTTNLKNAYKKYSHNYNLRSRPISYAEDEIVLKKSFRKSDQINKFSAKLASQFEKCRVKKKIGNSTYELEDLSGKRLGKFHSNDLKKFIA